MQPTSRYAENPSWLAVKPLHNTVLKVDVAIEPILPSDHPPGACPIATREIHITALQIPVTYEAVLSTVPGLHVRPPVLPPSSDPFIPTATPPPEGYDLFFHVGVIGRGSLRMEHVGHKFGYNMKDSTGALAPIVRVSREENNQPPEVQRMEFARLRDYTIESPVDGTDMPKRGFGKGYESFPEDISTDIDVEKLVHHLKKCGVEVSNSSLFVVPFMLSTLDLLHIAPSKYTPPWMPGTTSVTFYITVLWRRADALLPRMINPSRHLKLSFYTVRL